VSAVRKFLLGSVVLFGVIGGYAYLKKQPVLPAVAPSKVVEITLPELRRSETSLISSAPIKQPAIVQTPSPEPSPVSSDLPNVDRISQLFALDSSKLSFVETVSYTSRVPWLKDRPAWIADYASYYETSRHFIARSLNKKLDYFTQKVSFGDRFNVFKKDKQIKFHLLIDLSRCRLWFYAIDAEANERILLKTYSVGIGRIDQAKASGFLTPCGKYLLGDKIAIYKPGTIGFYQDNKMEMVRIFGTRWIPFAQEIEGCTEPAKGFGLHGAPWIEDSTGQLVEDFSKISTYDSDGCIRLASKDIEEIFSIIITKPTMVELVKNFYDAKLPGVEKQ
jgi:hypothetical protein